MTAHRIKVTVFEVRWEYLRAGQWHGHQEFYARQGKAKRRRALLRRQYKKDVRCEVVAHHRFIGRKSAAEAAAAGAEIAAEALQQWQAERATVERQQPEEDHDDAVITK